MRFVLLGAPGSGKGTCAAVLENLFCVPRISTGDLFRRHLENETELGRLAAAFIARGELVPDDVTCAMVTGRLAEADTAQGFILDGFPRTCAQAAVLSGILDKAGCTLDQAIEVACPDAIIVDRISGRRVCRQCGRSYHIVSLPPKRAGICDVCAGSVVLRADDQPDIVAARLKIYHEKTAPLLTYYQDRHQLVTIDNSGGLIVDFGVAALVSGTVSELMSANLTATGI